MQRRFLFIQKFCHPFLRSALEIPHGSCRKIHRPWNEDTEALSSIEYDTEVFWVAYLHGTILNSPVGCMHTVHGMQIMQIISGTQHCCRCDGPCSWKQYHLLFSASSFFLPRFISFHGLPKVIKMIIHFNYEFGLINRNIILLLLSLNNNNNNNYYLIKHLIFNNTKKIHSFLLSC